MTLRGFFMTPSLSKKGIEMRLGIRYKSNPFINEMVINTKAKQVRVSAYGRDGGSGMDLVNRDTGEIRGTHIVTYKRVDEEQFVKLFTAQVGAIFDLKAAGIKALTVLMWAVQYKAMGRDVVCLDRFTLDDFLGESSLTLSKATYQRGINELEKAQIIAKTQKKGDYFINPNFLFNGDRVAFTTALEKVAPEEQTELPFQDNNQELAI